MEKDTRKYKTVDVTLRITYEIRPGEENTSPADWDWEDVLDTILTPNESLNMVIVKDVE